MKSNYILLRKITFVIFLFSISGFAQVKKDTLNVLFVGNSYTYYENMPQIVSLISEKTNTYLRTKKTVIGGARLREHWHSERGLKTKELIENGNFDCVILQDQSMVAIQRPDSLMKYANLFADFIRAHNAKPYLYHTWSRENTPETQIIINEVFNKVATASNSMIIPVGYVWHRAQKENSKAALYAQDGSHPDKLGAFLTACTMVRVLSGKLPEKLERHYITRDIHNEVIILMSVQNAHLDFCKEILKLGISDFENDTTR